MATTYKTPGVFVEEIPKLPPSVAQVETALPAFVGYTNKADEIAPGDLINKPKRIGSLVEFEQFYGTGPSPEVTEVNIDSNNNFTSATVKNTFFMYDSLRMFYANGGGDCYIVSVGKSEKATTISKSNFTTGIDELRKEDAPTIILFPDAATLGNSELAEVQQAALLQCADLGDRVGLFDVKQDDPLGTNFRNNIGINNLKYGAVYSPWLKVNLPKAIKYTDVKSVIKRAGISVPLSGLTSDVEVQGLITELEQAYADVANIETKTKVLSPPNGVLSDGFSSLVAAFNAPLGNTNGNLKNIFDYFVSIGNQIQLLANGVAPNILTHPDFLADVKAGITSNFDPLFAKIKALNFEAIADITVALAGSDFTALTVGSWPLTVAAAAPVAPGLIDETNDNNRRIAAVNLLQPLFDELNTAYLNLIVNAGNAYTKTLDDSLVLVFPVYKNIINGVSKSMTVMPPSGAVAGVYAQVDRTRGVWKAPANVSLNNVLAPATVFTATQLDNLNVDAVAGKSVNAIRYFTGKGTLVFGSRTLAGNDNEWRYVPVRRFFNMVEESCKKSTEPFVFEPNDANTWVKIQGMIENFLTTLWRQGALQGVKPEHAFYVAVGLGKTMTSLDILEGRLIVEIGMAVVRPAEFIILRFSHKLAES
ncbi:MAG: phage tail sheath subtilisin-like domain-containing protein [Prolixibacteraceae bacterium]|nr:phage tail sheath subtilisin-like domain-containing protein [Prolixibacteraceae bacterium]